MTASRSDSEPVLLNVCQAAGRRGSVLSGILIALSITGAFVFTAWLVTPAYLHGQSQAQPQAISARAARHQEVIELIAALIRSSTTVAAIHQRGATPYAEIVLRITGNGEVARRNEVALLSHSRVLQTITLYHYSDSTTEIAMDALAGPGFPDLVRSDPSVEARILATGVSDLNVRMSSDMLRIALTWAADSADGEDEASVLIPLSAVRFQESANTDPAVAK